MSTTPRRHLPIVDESILDNLKIATPCSADWDAMAGDDRVRHCGDCRLNVYDVSQMTRKEAATLIAMNEGGRTCMRLYKRPDGTLITQDCWARLRAARQRGWVAFAAALVIVCFTQLGLRFAGLKWLMNKYNDRPTVTTGSIAMPAPPPPVPSSELMGHVMTPPEPIEMGALAPPPPPPKKPVKRAKPHHEPEMGKLEAPVRPLMGDVQIDR